MARDLRANTMPKIRASPNSRVRRRMNPPPLPVLEGAQRIEITLNAKLL